MLESGAPAVQTSRRTVNNPGTNMAVNQSGNISHAIRHSLRLTAAAAIRGQRRRLCPHLGGCDALEETAVVGEDVGDVEEGDDGAICALPVSDLEAGAAHKVTRSPGFADKDSAVQIPVKTR